MKKLVMIMAVGAICVSSFAQGNLTFSNNSAKRVWNAYQVAADSSPDTGTLRVALLVSANTAAVPTTFLSGASTPTNEPVAPAMNATWTGILSDPNFKLATNNSSGLLITTTAGGTGPALGIYNGGLLSLQGFAEGQTIALYVLAWSRAFATPIDAMNANGVVGFSQKITYTLGSVGIPGGSIVAANAGNTGNGPVDGFGILNVPEPSTFALAGLGAAAMLIFRRRKQ
jgi:hypothetical protein